MEAGAVRIVSHSSVLTNKVGNKYNCGANADIDEVVLKLLNTVSIAEDTLGNSAAKGGSGERSQSSSPRDTALNARDKDTAAYKQRLAIPFHDRDFVDHDFTAERIEGEGNRLLYRALNAGRAVGFIGSGVPSAFGRPTWSQLIGATKQLVLPNGVKATSSLAILDGVKGAKQDAVSDPDFLPLLAHLIRIEGRKTASAHAVPKQHDEDPVQESVKEIVRDDDFVAKEAWKPFLPSTRDQRAFCRWLDSWNGVLGLLQRLGRLDLVDQVQARQAETGGARISAEERLLAPLLLAIVHTTGVDKSALIAKLSKDHIESAATDSAYDTSDAGRCKSNDPVRLILEELGIRRLITTNYDFELERALERLGFQRRQLRPPLEGGSSLVPDILEAERPSGGRARAVVFKRETAAELASFAVRANTHDYEIFHLHGRAVKGSNERLVITEPDYQDVYMRDAPEAHVMTEALTATMAGNPLVFIGMGMLEGDFLRPLRQFVAGPGARINRNIIALLPAEEEASRRAKTALHLHLRYGVHSIFYGQSRTGGEAPLYLAIDELRRRRTELKPGSGASRHRMVLKESRAALAQFAEVPSNAGAKVGRTSKTPNATSKDLLHGSLAAAEALFASKELWQSDDARLALTTYLYDLEGRIRARALVHALRVHARGRVDWWEEWRELPKHRSFRHTVEVPKGVDGAGKPKWVDSPTPASAHLPREVPGPVRIIRYRVEGSELGDLNQFEDVLKHILDSPPGEKRRVFIVHGETGSGRGSLFHYLADHFARKSTSRLSPYDWGLFTNANFSTEYSSVVDGVLHFLMRCTKSQFQQYTDVGFSKLPRREAVAEYLKTILAADQHGRGMFVVGGAELLFRGADGVPKNSEIVDALAPFLDRDSAAYKLDVVLISRTDKLRAIFADELDPLLDVQDIKARFGQSIHVDSENPKSRLIATRVGPQFDAKVIRLQRPDLNDTMDKAVNEANSRLRKTAKAGRTAPDPIDRIDIHKALQDPLAEAIKGRFLASIVAQCAIETTVAKGASAFAGFLGTLRDALTREEVGKTADIILAAVLNQYTALHQDDEHIRPTLFHLILKHVAIMAGPVEVSVLACCPELRAACDAVARSESELNMMLAQHLEWLESKKLLFKLRSRDEFRSGKPDPLFQRYAAHKMLQGYFFHRLGAPFLELGDARLFTVSLCASQGTNLPAPSHASFKFMRDLIQALIEYPQVEGTSRRLRTEANRQREVCALRVAVSLVRSAFSFAVVSRFSDFDDAPWLNESRFGFFEQYRLMLRWMIFRAGMLADHKYTEEYEDQLSAHRNELISNQFSKTEATAEAERICLKYRLNALYRDEITWLYNECGLVALAQGNLNQAQRLLSQALESNRLIEIGPDTGPNALRIRLNQAVVQLEQADLKGANAALRGIDEASRREPVVNAVARGYRGLLAHLRGRSTQARELYDKAIDLLRRLGEARAISIFRKHLADLKRKTGDIQGCRLDLLGALAEAEGARQTDQVHRVQISLALCDMADSHSPEQTRRVFHRLDDAIRYADRMEIPVLKAEALLARTQAIHRQGETRAAGEEVVKAMAISSLYGQRLRAITALGRLGEVVADRAGHEAQGERILVAAGKMADACEYQLAKWKIGEGLIGRPMGASAHRGVTKQP